MSLATWDIEMQAAARALLIATVAASADTPRPAFAWEGEAFTPPTGPFIAESFRNDTTRLVSGSRRNGRVEHRATFALVLRYPPATGTKTARTIAGLIMTAFTPGTTLARNGCSAWVEAVDPRPGFQEPDRYVLPLNIVLRGYSNTEV